MLTGQKKTRKKTSRSVYRVAAQLKTDGTLSCLTPLFSMPDMSDVGPPAKGPGLPERVPEAPPPPVKVRVEHGRSCREQQQLKEAILKEVPEAQVELVEVDDGKTNP